MITKLNEVLSAARESAYFLVAADFRDGRVDPTDALRENDRLAKLGQGRKPG